jgi:hypothetical protein
MKTSAQISSRSIDAFTIKNLLLLCGILSSLLYVAMNIFVAMRYPGYNSAAYTVSELSAIGAPTRSLWTSWAFVYTILMIAFALGVMKGAAGNRAVRVMGILILIYGALGFGWHFAPMHQREVIAAGGGTFSDTMHLVFSFVTVLLMVAAMCFGAAAFGKTFRWYSIVSLIILTIFGIITGIVAPNIDANQPTPLIGVWERINIGVFLLWVITLASLLLTRENKLRERNNVW